MEKLQLSANAVKMDFLLGFVRAMLLICYSVVFLPLLTEFFKHFLTPQNYCDVITVIKIISRRPN